MPVTGLSKAQKFVRLFEWLQQPNGIRAHDVQSKLDLDSRTLRRYLADLRDLGIEILDEGRGSERTLRLDPSYKRRGVELTLLEAVSMRFGRTLFNFLGGTQFAAVCAQLVFMRPWCVAIIPSPEAARDAAEWVSRIDATAGPDTFVLNVGGPRESESPGIYADAVKFLNQVTDSLLRRVAHP